MILLFLLQIPLLTFFRMSHAGIRCPKVVLLKKQILVMSFIGNEQRSAPKLKDVALTPTQGAHAYKQCVEVL